MKINDTFCVVSDEAVYALPGAVGMIELDVRQIKTPTAETVGVAATE